MALNIINCSLCEHCTDVCELDVIAVSTTGNEFVFIIESTGALTIKNILVEALKLLKEKTKEFNILVDEF